MSTGRFHRLRRLIGSVLILLLIALPFVRVGGESAFRFDVPTLQLLFFGTRTGMADFFIILIALIFITFFALFATTLFGRIWCGWLCPQTILMDSTDFMEKARERGLASRAAAAGAGIAAAAVIAAGLVGYFVDPFDLSALLRGGGTSAKIVIGSWSALAVLLYLDLSLLRRKFCATVCPYAKLQSVLFDDRTLQVAYDAHRADECMECMACVKACPVGIDIRKGTHMACIHCAECVDACAARMAGKRSSLVNYSFGIPGSQGSGLRVSLLITGLITALSLLFLIYLTTTRMPFDVSFRLHYTAEPLRQADGSVTTIYDASFRNTSPYELMLGLNAEPAEGTAVTTPAAVTLPKNPDVMRLPVAVTVSGQPGKPGVRKITMTVTSSRDKKSVSKTLYFMMPGG